MTSYLDLDDFVETAAEVLGLDEATMAKIARLDLAESALHAPQASWGGVEFYSDFAAKAGEETYQQMVAIAAAPAEDLDRVEAETAAWIADRLSS